MIDNIEVTTEQWGIQHEKQGTPSWADEYMDIVVCGVNMKDPNYLKSVNERIHKKEAQMKKDNPHLFMPTNQPTNMSKEV